MEAQTDSSMQVAPQGGPHHAFLFMSDPDSSQTTVMRLGDGMDRVVPDESCGMMFSVPTVAAGNILDHTCIVQVHLMLLLQSVHCQCCPALLCSADHASMEVGSNRAGQSVKLPFCRSKNMQRVTVLGIGIAEE